MPDRTFYRIVASNPPTTDDFTSNEARGRPLSNPSLERRELWRGLSAYASPARACLTARKYPIHGRFIAKLVIGEDAPIRSRRALGAEPIPQRPLTINVFRRELSP